MLPYWRCPLKWNSAEPRCGEGNCCVKSYRVLEDFCTNIFMRYLYYRRKYIIYPAPRLRPSIVGDRQARLSTRASRPTRQITARNLYCMPLAHKIGSLLFCPECGTLLDIPADGENEVICDQCKHVEPASSFENIEIVTESHPDAFPSALRQARKTQTKKIDQLDAMEKVLEQCPQCGHGEAYIKQLQLRSADEGSTNLYTCVSCKYGWQLNN